jgi:hypothetical protein
MDLHLFSSALNSDFCWFSFLLKLILYCAAQKSLILMNTQQQQYKNVIKQNVEEYDMKTVAVNMKVIFSMIVVT